MIKMINYKGQHCSESDKMPRKGLEIDIDVHFCV